MNRRSDLITFNTLSSHLRTGKVSLQKVQSLICKYLQSNSQNVRGSLDRSFKILLVTPLKKSLTKLVAAFFSKFMGRFLPFGNLLHEWLIRLCRFSTQRVGSERLGLS